MTIRLGVNIDHIATLRNARGSDYPCPVQGALLCQQAGADGITLHLREDRRHIKDADVYAIKNAINIPLNLEMAVTQEMLNIACSVRPAWVCLVPEKRAELTTEGGLDVLSVSHLPPFIKTLQNHGIKVSLFIDPDPEQITASIACGADAIELHTGTYATRPPDQRFAELNRLKQAVDLAKGNGTLLVNAGHGLTQENVAAVAQLPGLYELNIGHAIIADSIFMGLERAVKAMRAAF